MLDETIFGEFDDNRVIVRDVKKCASTGLNIASGDALIPIKGSKNFFRLKGQVYRVTEIRDDVIDLYWSQIKDTKRLEEESGAKFFKKA